MQHSAIEWTDATWNPVRGCTKISPGCKHCYAETFAERFRGVPGHPYEQGFDLSWCRTSCPSRSKWTTPKMIFVNSMSDLFHEDVPRSFVEQVARVMQMADWHTYQVLTKRAEHMRDMLRTAGLRRRAAAYLVGRQRRGSQVRPPRIDAPASRLRPPSGSCRSSRCSKIWARST